jgi:MoaA/NifB/PqqE/SkfB family radical SAM enzyme
VKELKGLTVAGPATEKQEKEFFLQWHLTERCNLACRHCYQKGEHPGEMDLSGVREVAGEVSDMVKSWAEMYGITFSPSFNVTGGEPLLLPHIFDILEALKRQGFEVYLLTNGTLIDGESAGRLSGLVDGVQISIEGPEAVHDAVRGKGAFLKACLGAEKLVAEHVSVSLNTTLSALNVAHLDDIFSLGLGLGVRRIGFSRLVPYGRGEALVHEMLTPEQVRDAYRQVRGFNTGLIEAATGDPIASSMDGGAEDAGEIAFAGCAAGVSGLTLLSDGTIMPCRRLPVAIGNVQTDSVREVWATSPVLNLLRERTAYTGRCGRCRCWAKCRGCRAIAYACSASSGKADILADDPQCFL